MAHNPNAPTTANAGDPFGLRVQPRAAASPDVRSIEINRIQPNPWQPRRTFNEAGLAELAESIRASGLLQPILVRPFGDNFQLLAGQRRWRASHLAGLTVIPAIVRPVTDAHALEIALVENLQREDLNAVERGIAYEQYLTTFAASIEYLAKRLGESRTNVSNYVRIAKLPEEVRTLILSGQLGFGQAKALAGVSDPLRQIALAKLISRRNLSARQAEDLVTSAARGMEPADATPGATAKASNESTLTLRDDADARHAAQVEQSLSRAVGLPVKLHLGRRKNTGKIVINYASLEEFDLISQKLAGRSILD